MRKVYANVVVKVVMTLNEDVTVADALSDMEYEFNISEDQGWVEDTEIVDWDVKDSK
jgi:histidinol phosphatase-like enzyme